MKDRTKADDHMIFPAVAGLGVFLGLQLFFWLTWERLFAWAQVREAWWLNSGKSLVVTVVVVFVCTVVVLAVHRGPVPPASLAMMAGLVLGMIGSFFVVVGGSNLWPIALTFGVLLLGMSVVLASLVAAVLRRAWTRRGAEG